MITEELLHFVWKLLYFDFSGLTTTLGEPISIVHNGIHNMNQGPDFLHAKVKIGETEWNGSIEIHIHSEDWYHHKHQNDTKYNNVILHVVYYSKGGSILRQDGSICPEVVLEDKIPKDIHERYEVLQHTHKKIPCASLIHTVDAFHKYAWIERMGLIRMAEKAEKIRQRYEATLNWEQVAWELMMRYMGGTLNGDIFERIARGIPYSIIKKYRHNPFTLEALIWGFVWDSSGEIPPEDSDLYLRRLWEEYCFLRQKHDLITLTDISFSYFRMRPTAFPDIRLAQIVQLVCEKEEGINLFMRTEFSGFIQSKVETSDYWLTHYRAGVLTKPIRKPLGKDRKMNLIINAFAPFAYSYRVFYGHEDAESLLENTLSNLPPEVNSIIEEYDRLGVKAQNSLHSQGIMQLSEYYCNRRKCLHCAIGTKILKNTH